VNIRAVNRFAIDLLSTTDKTAVDDEKHFFFSFAPTIVGQPSLLRANE
jgi:hypothetical protein